MKSPALTRLILVPFSLIVIVLFSLLLKHHRDVGLLVGCALLSSLSLYYAYLLMSGQAYVKIFGFGENTPWLNRLGSIVFLVLGVVFAVLAVGHVAVVL